MAGLKIVKIANRAREDIRDSEGDLLPRELLMFVNLENGSRYGVRGSGTEPKIKIYVLVGGEPVEALELDQQIARIDALAQSVIADAVASVTDAMQPAQSAG